MNKKIKAVAACAMSAVMALSISACSQDGNPAVTTNLDFEDLVNYIEDNSDDYSSQMSGASKIELNVEKKIKYLGWWPIDETQASVVLFKQLYGIPEQNDGDNIFDYNYVDYELRYDKLTSLVTTDSKDAPDIFQFEIINYPYTATKKLFQPIDDYINFDDSLWDANREYIENFKWDGKAYCAITAIGLDQLLWYRKSVIEENNLDDPYQLFKENKWDWNSFLDICSKFSNPTEGKYCIDGWQIPDRFVSTTGVPMIGLENGKLVNNFYNADIERCMTTVIDQMFKQNYRYPRHELNGWSISVASWVDGNTLFYGTLSNAIKDEFQTNFKREGWEDGDVTCVPFPKDPNSEKYYQAMKIDPWMFCNGSDNYAGYVAWNLCSMATATDKNLESIGDEQMMTNYEGYTQEFLDYLRSLQYDGIFTPVFDFKAGIGQDLVDGSTVNNPVDCLTQLPYLTGKDTKGETDATFSQLRDANFSTVQKRIDDLNAGNL